VYSASPAGSRGDDGDGEIIICLSPRRLWCVSWHRFRLVPGAAYHQPVDRLPEQERALFTVTTRHDFIVYITGTRVLTDQDGLHSLERMESCQHQGSSRLSRERAVQLVFGTRESPLSRLVSWWIRGDTRTRGWTRPPTLERAGNRPMNMALPAGDELLRPRPTPSL
jgi:hypothetical protein